MKPCPKCQTLAPSETLQNHYHFFDCPNCKQTYVAFIVSPDHKINLKKLFGETRKNAMR